VNAPLARPPSTDVSRRIADRLWAAGAGLVAFTVYVRTLAPGLVDDVDGAMFQFIGRVLGVAHNPGYPLYVLLTYVFSWLPMGTLAWRINVFSALFGAVTVSLAFLIGRELACRRTISLAVALSLAFGPLFWSQAVVAEVYTLNAACVAGVLLALLIWRRTGGPTYFYVAVAILAAALGNHTTIVGFVPGMVLYALLVKRRFAMRWRTLLISAAILGAGLLQYVFILVRSGQAGAYVESRATTLTELVGVVLGSQFRDRLFRFDWRTVLVDRVPAVGQSLWAELSMVGVVLAAVGLLWLLWRRRADAVLMLPGALAIVVFAANYAVVDAPVFLIPALFVLWIAVGIGAEQLARLLGRTRLSGAAAGAAMLLLPAWLLTHNFAARDRSREVQAAVQIDALFDALPQRAALVREDFLVDRMLSYALIGDGAADDRDVTLTAGDASSVRRRVDDGRPVFGFAGSAWRLRYEALNFSFMPLDVAEGRLDAFLDRLPDGAVVAIAAPGRLAPRFAAARGVSFAAIGRAGALGLDESSLVIVGSRGVASGAIVERGSGAVDVRVPERGPVGGTGVLSPASIELHSDALVAAIRQGGRDIVRTRSGAVLAVWGPDGRLIRAGVLPLRDGFRVPLPASSLSVYPLRGLLPTLAVRTASWTDLRAVLRTGSAIVRAPAGQAVVLYLRDEGRLAPRVIDQTSRRVTVQITSFNGADRVGLAPQLASDHADPAALTADGHIYRIEVRAGDDSPESAFLSVGGIPAEVIGRVESSDPAAQGAAIEVDTEGLLRAPDASSEVLLMTRDDQAQLTGDGWSAVEADETSAYRWMTETEGRLVLPIANADPARIRVQAWREALSAATTMRLRLNGAELPAQPLQEGWHAYEWTLPDGAMTRGANEAEVIVDRLSARDGDDRPPREVAVTEVRVIRDEP
jgi:hypothetical protein